MPFFLAILYRFSRHEVASSASYFLQRVRSLARGLTIVFQATAFPKVVDLRVDKQIRATVELDLTEPRVIAWGIAAVMADLSRLRRSGWPKAIEEEEVEIESIETALGPRKHRNR